MSGILALTQLEQPARIREALGRLAFLGGDQEHLWSDADSDSDFETAVAVTRKA